MTILDRVRSWFEPYEPLTAGFYQYQTPPDAEQQFRLHLRVEKDGHGLLLINAARVLHLNQTATELASSILQEKTAEEEEARPTKVEETSPSAASSSNTAEKVRRRLEQLGYG